MSLSMFDTPVTIIPGNFSTTNRELSYKNEESQEITDVMAKFFAETKTTNFNELVVFVDYGDTIRPGYIIKDQSTGLEYNVLDADPKPCAINTDYYKLIVKLKGI